MNTIELSDEMEKLQVPPAEYSIGRPKDNAFIIICKNGKWRVYFIEKGQVSEEACFDDEAEACDDFLAKIKRFASNLAKF